MLEYMSSDTNKLYSIFKMVNIELLVKVLVGINYFHQYTIFAAAQQLHKVSFLFALNLLCLGKIVYSLKSLTLANTVSFKSFFRLPATNIKPCSSIATPLKSSEDAVRTKHLLSQFNAFYCADTLFSHLGNLN